MPRARVYEFMSEVLGTWLSVGSDSPLSMYID